MIAPMDEKNTYHSLYQDFLSCGIYTFRLIEPTIVVPYAGERECHEAGVASQAERNRCLRSRQYSLAERARLSIYLK